MEFKLLTFEEFCDLDAIPSNSFDFLIFHLPIFKLISIPSE